MLKNVFKNKGIASDCRMKGYRYKRPYLAMRILWLAVELSVNRQSNTRVG